MDDHDVIESAQSGALESKHDPLMTAFVVFIIALLVVFAILILVANGRMPDNL